MCKKLWLQFTRDVSVCASAATEPPAVAATARAFREPAEADSAQFSSRPRGAFVPDAGCGARDLASSSLQVVLSPAELLEVTARGLAPRTCAQGLRGVEATACHSAGQSAAGLPAVETLAGPF